MARPLRFEYPGAMYHVIVRGNRRDTIFEDDEDRTRFLSDLERVAARYGWTILAYCLMGNHYHLLVLVGDTGLKSGMRDLNSAYCQAFNRRRGLVGHVLQGRYKSPIVEEDRYLAVLVRYIVRNPVRANLCVHPAEWPWSSYLATIGRAPTPPFLSPHAVLEHFGQTEAQARLAFERFVESDGDDLGWDPLSGRAIMGAQSFVEYHAEFAISVDPTEVSRVQRDPSRPTLAEALDQPLSDGVLLQVQRRWGYSISAIARAIGVHPSTVTRRLRRAEQALLPLPTPPTRSGRREA